LRAEYAVGESHDGAARVEAQSACRSTLGHALTAGARIDRAFRACVRGFRDLFAAAGARIDRSELTQAMQCRVICRPPCALIEHLAIPFKAERLEAAQDRSCGPRLDPKRVEIVDTQEPLAAMRLGLEVAAGRRYQRAEVQRTGRSRREATAIRCAD